MESVSDREKEIKRNEYDNGITIRSFMSERYPIIVQVATFLIILSLLVMNVYVIYRLSVADRLAKYEDTIKRLETNVGQLNTIINKNFSNGKLENPFAQPQGGKK